MYNNDSNDDSVITAVLVIKATALWTIAIAGWYTMVVQAIGG